MGLLNVSSQIYTTKSHLHAFVSMLGRILLAVVEKAIFCLHYQLMIEDYASRCFANAEDSEAFLGSLRTACTYMRVCTEFRVHLFRGICSSVVVLLPCVHVGAPELQHTGYGQQHHQYHTNSAQPDSRQNHPGGSYQTSAYPSSPSVGHSFYENWEVSKKKADRCHDQTHPGTAAVGEMTGKLSKLGVGTSVLPPRPDSREPTPAASSVPTNAELQYQTSQQVQSR